MLRKSKAGRIINISSVAASGNIGHANYAASKAGVIGLTKTLALEVGRYHLTVNAVAPGFIDTDMTRDVPEQAREHWLEKVPAGRAGTAEDVAHTVNRWLDPDTGSSNLGLFGAMVEEGADGKKRGIANAVEVIDSHTIKFNLKQPALAMPLTFATVRPGVGECGLNSRREPSTVSARKLSSDARMLPPAA